MRDERDTRWARIEALYLEHYDALVRLVAFSVDDVAAAEEVVQDAFVSVAGHLDRVDDPSKAAAYLRSAALNGARSRLRRRGTRRRHLRSVATSAVAPSAEQIAVDADEERRVRDALTRLSDRQRDVLLLRYHLDLSEAEIAATLGISAGSVKTHASRGLDRLGQLLEESS